MYRDNLHRMTESTTTSHLTADLETRLAEKLGIKRGALTERLRRTGRHLPRWIHKDAQVLMHAQTLDAHPKLRRRLDKAQLVAAHGRIVRHLDGIDTKERRKSFWLGILGSLAFKLLAVVALVLVVLRWRGMI